MPVSLLDAARELDLELSVLRRWIKRAGIPLENDPADRRRRMLSTEDFERLCRERKHIPLVPAEDAPAHPAVAAQALSTQLESLRESLLKTNNATNGQLAATNGQLAALIYSVTELNERLARLEERLRE